jgi:hypothetical protein
MKKPILVLLALLTIVPLAQATAQTPVAAPPASSAQAPTTAQFLATLAIQPIKTPNDLPPAPLFNTGCTSSTDCPTGQLCCNVCGNPPVDGGSCRACLTPIRGRCPLIE